MSYSTSTNNGSLIRRGGGFFPNLRSKPRGESNLSHNAYQPPVTNIGSKGSRMIALPNLNDSNSIEEPSYFHTQSN